MKEHKRKLPILKLKYSIIMYTDASELYNRFPDVDFDIDLDDMQGGFFQLEDRFYICLLNDNKLTPGKIAHECKHFINRAFHIIGYQLERDNDEMECYFLTHVVDQVHKILQVN